LEGAVDAYFDLSDGFLSELVVIVRNIDGGAFADCFTGDEDGTVVWQDGGRNANPGSHAAVAVLRRDFKIIAFGEILSLG